MKHRKSTHPVVGSYFNIFHLGVIREKIRAMPPSSRFRESARRGSPRDAAAAARCSAAASAARLRSGDGRGPGSVFSCFFMATELANCQK